MAKEAPDPLAAHDPFDVEGLDQDEPNIPQVMKRLEILTRRRVESLFAGAYQAVFQGQGMVFSDVRPYQPGDEVRWIDWNVSARMNDLYVKQFIEERERTVMLLYDASRSMVVGRHRRSKRELCAEVAMLLAMSASHNGDRVGMIIFSQQVDAFISPGRGKKHIMRMIQTMLSYKPAETTQHTDLKEALLFLNRVSPRHSISFVLSDFLAPHEEGVWQLLGKQHELIPIVFEAPQDHSLPFAKEAKEAPEGALPALASPTPSAFEKWLPLGTGVLLLGASVALGGAFWLGGLIAFVICVLVTWLLQRDTAPAICQLQDAESQVPMVLDLQRSSTHKRFARIAQHREEQQTNQFRRLQTDAVTLSTEEDYMPPLLKFFRMRQRTSR